MNWISCETKLPDKDGVYIISGLVTVEPGDKPIPFTDAAEYVSWRAIPWIPITDTEGIYDFTVTAWMPLPEPYETTSENV